LFVWDGNRKSAGPFLCQGELKPGRYRIKVKRQRHGFEDPPLQRQLRRPSQLLRFWGPDSGLEFLEGLEFLLGLGGFALFAIEGSEGEVGLGS
jgi:hypothetical protein